MLFNTSLLSQRIYFTPLAFVSIFFTLFGLQEAFIWEIPHLTRHWQSLAAILLRVACLDGICDSFLLWKLKYHLFLGLFIKHKKTVNDITFRCGKVKNHKSHKPTSLSLFLSCSMQWREEGEEPSIYALLSFPHFPVSGLKSTSPLSSPVMTPSNELAARLVSGCRDQSERKKKQHPFQAIFFFLITARLNDAFKTDN